MALTTISNLWARTFDLLLSRGLILNRRHRVTGFNARTVPELLCSVTDEPGYSPFAFGLAP
jgi:hypothetical protein